MTIHINISGQGKPLVFFHGWGFDHQIWLGLVASLESRFQLFLVDLPGFGQSELVSWDEFKAQLFTVLPEKFSLIGWSMGGLYASRLAIEASERVSHLVNVASSPYFIKEENWPGVDPLVFKQFFTSLKNNSRQALSDFIALQLRKQDYDYSHSLLPAVASLYAGLEILASWDLREQLKGLNAAVCYIFGGLDAITPRSTLTAMRQQYPQFSYQLLPKAAHMPFLSHQLEFIEILEEFIQ